MSVVSDFDLLNAFRNSTYRTAMLNVNPADTVVLKKQARRTIHFLLIWHCGCGRCFLKNIVF